MPELCCIRCHPPPFLNMKANELLAFRSEAPLIGPARMCAIRAQTSVVLQPTIYEAIQALCELVNGTVRLQKLGDGGCRDTP